MSGVCKVQYTRCGLKFTVEKEIKMMMAEGLQFNLLFTDVCLSGLVLPVLLPFLCLFEEINVHLS